MKHQRYHDWIATWLRSNDPLGRCGEATKEMAATFPELRRVRGHHYDAAWGEREHWWLVAADGTIIDPTAQQFPGMGRGHYEEWDESQPEPTGTCPNCGGYCHDSAYCCSKACEREFMNSLR